MPCYGDSEACGANLWPPRTLMCRGSEAGQHGAQGMLIVNMFNCECVKVEK